ncbi:MAG TPA: sugar ABC transporter substrate-binding protein [Ktedonobacteraceae bacterium]|jgi:multiple sugar transport system substrate-binding protein
MPSEQLDTAKTRRDVLKMGGALAASTFALPTILTACGTGSSINKTLQVYWSTGHMYKTYTQVTQKFEQDHPGWKVNVEPYQWTDMRTKLLSGFAAHRVPDLVEVQRDWVQEFALDGDLLSLEANLKVDGKKLNYPDDWQPYAVNHNQINGVTYGIQLHLTCPLIFYNKDMFAKAGITQPPKTWDEFLTVAQALTHSNVYGFAADSTVWPWLLQNNVSYYDLVKREVPMATPDTYQALQFITDLIHKYKVSPIPVSLKDATNSQKLFSAQRVAMYYTGPWDIAPIMSGSPNLNWGIAQALTAKSQKTTTNGTSLVIPKDANNAEMAWELFQNYLSLDTELAVTKEGLMTMPRKSWAASPQVKAESRIAPFGVGLTYAEPETLTLDLTGQSGAIENLFTTALGDIIYNQHPVPATMQQFVTAANKLAQKGSK